MMEGKRNLHKGIGFLSAFVLWTVLIQLIDVQAAGPKGTRIGFAAFNVWFHQLTGVHMTVYAITDWLGLVPIFICLCFGGLGFMQLIKRRSLKRVDKDILLLGAYYLLVISAYLLFEMIPINYRPILIEGRLEASYPSSTTLLVLSVMPTLVFQTKRRCADPRIRKTAARFAIGFSAFMVIGRLISGVHWATDILASVLLSAGLFLLYRSAVLYADERKEDSSPGRENGVQ
jgi:undecaprenyl-diphosphatase